MRITGLATGLDTDNLIKDMMKGERMKVDKVKGDKLLVEYKQERYRSIIKESKGFYNKYFSVSSKDSLIMNSNWQSVSFKSSNSAIEASGSTSANVENYKVKVESLASPAKGIISDEDLKKNEVIKVSIGDKTIEVKLTKENDKGEMEPLSSDEIVENLNTALEKKEIGVRVKYSEFSKGIAFESTKVGEETKFNLQIAEKAEGPFKDVEVRDGINSKATITKSNGETYIHNSNKNTVTLDGVTFKFNDVTKEEESLTGKRDVTEIKDKIVNFVNDYNKLIEGINKEVSGKKDRKYTPLTEEQKKEMSEDEIKLWNEKVKSGLLRNDSDLTRISNSLKSIMRETLGGLKLENMGIKPINDFGLKNGTFTIDEKALEESLSKNPEDVKNFFLGDAKDEKSKGILGNLKTVLYDEFETVEAPLLKKAGIEGSVTAFNNSLTKTMEKKQKLIHELEKEFKRKEDALYMQFSRLETQMSKLNSQSAYLMQQMGM